MSIEEKIYHLIGTRHSPTEDRVELIKTLTIYLSVYDKISSLEIFKKDVDSFFDDYPHLSSASFYVGKDREIFFYINEIELFFSKESIDEDREKNNDSIQNDLIGLMLKHEDILESLYNFNIDNFVLDKGSAQAIEKIIIPTSQMEIYNKIENFEKNKLEGIIAARNTNKSLKL